MTSFSDIASLVNSIHGTASRPDYAQRLFEISSTLSNPKLFVEIGSFIGGSGICLAYPHKGGDLKMLCIDPKFMSGEALELKLSIFPENELDNESYLGAKAGLFLEQFNRHIQSVGLEQQMFAVPGFSEDIFSTFDHRSIDLVYIDGAHQYAAVRKDCRFLDYVISGGYAVFDDWISEVEQAVMEYVGACGNWTRVDSKFPVWFKKT